MRTVTDRFTDQLPADPILKNERRIVEQAAFSWVNPIKSSKPELVHVANEFAAELGFKTDELASETFTDLVSGNTLFKNSKPYAMCYGGHQFGQWAGQLGDGRATNLGELTHNNKIWALQLKGAGPTPYSRSADGLAVLRSSVREHLCSEAMHYLGVPTTRSLSLSVSGDQVLRDMLYNGNAAYEKGAVVCRVAPSFIRFGNFEIFAAREDKENLKKLADFVCKHFYSTITASGKEKYIQLFEAVAKNTQNMVLHWQRVGFVHGVMNTDNMSILGLTIDYGPYGWLENYDPTWTPNTTDNQNKRYRYENQPHITLWNLVKLANALFPLIKDTAPLEAILNAYSESYKKRYLDVMMQKVGIYEITNDDAEFISALEEMLEECQLDMTLFFRRLSSFSKTTKTSDYLELLIADSYLENWNESQTTKAKNGLAELQKRLLKEEVTAEVRAEKMNKINPKYVLRNYMAQLAIDAADKGDYSVISEFYELLKQPYNEQPNAEKWFAKRPQWAENKIGCSALSCSS